MSGNASASPASARISLSPTFSAATNCSTLFFQMASKYPTFDRTRLETKPQAKPVNDLDTRRWLALDEIAEPYSQPQLAEVAGRVLRARERGAARILMMGAHVLRA